MIRNEIKYSLTYILIPFQLAKRHKGINNVVNIIKKSEIPSKPNVRFKLKAGNHKISSTY
jgi:hypothetical protein